MTDFIRHDEQTRLTLANALTAFRLVAAPILIGLAIYGDANAFLWLLAASFATDAADGAVARYSGGPTEFGARFDSLADCVAYTAIAISVVLLWPDVVRRELPAFIAFATSLAAPAAVGLLKFGQLTSYHTRLVKISVGAAAIGLLLLLLDVSVWPFRIAAFFGVLSGVEQVAITLLLPKAKSDVIGIAAALRAWQSPSD